MNPERHKTSSKAWIASAFAVLATCVVVIHFLNRSIPELAIRFVPGENRTREEPENRRWTETAKEFVQRDERGPLRCSLQTRRGTPELEISLTNTSLEPVKFRGRNYLHDDFIFILRDTDEQIVNVASRYWLESSQTSNHIVLGPKETKSDTIEFHHATHDFQPTRPGLYSLEAVFSEEYPTKLFGWETGMHARSNRIPIHVEK